MKALLHKSPPTRPRGKRVENMERTRQSILRAALDLFADKGFYQTTTRAIAPGTIGMGPGKMRGACHGFCLVIPAS